MTVFGCLDPTRIRHRTIAAFKSGRSTYLATANEGDSRDYEGYAEETRAGSVTLDPTAFPNAAALKASSALGRLKITRSRGDTDGDGDYDQLYSFGTRSFSIWSDDGELVHDSGDDLEQITAQALPADFNSSNDANGSFDSRSDDKGPEPEALTVARVRGRQLAFHGACGRARTRGAARDRGGRQPDGPDPGRDDQ